MSDKTRTLNVERSTSTAHRLSHYDGVCGNIHGHNMKWNAIVSISMEGVGDSNMPVDLKEISDVIDEVDHAALLNLKDPLVDRHAEGQAGVEELFGDVIWFDGDPTCEVMARWMAKRIYEANDAIKHVNLQVAETDKYSIESSYREYEEEVED